MAEVDEETHFEHQSHEGGLLGLLTRNTLPVIAVLFIVGLSLTYFQLSRNQDDLVLRTAIQHAQSYSHVLDRIRKLYATEVVETAKMSGLEVTHDYRKHDGAIPLPITLSRELEHQLGPTGNGTVAKLYSPFPFEWREKYGTLPDDFARDAWKAFKENPERKDYHRVEPLNGVMSLRYAIPQVMQSDCIECHNTYEGTPKTDWKVDDVRGVVEIVYPIEQAESMARHTIWETLGILSPMLLIALIMLGLTLHQHRRWNRAIALRMRAQQRAKQELRVSEARYRTVLETNPDFNMIVDADGTIEFVNYASPDFEGGEVGSNIIDSLDPDRGQLIRAALDRALVSGELVALDVQHTGQGGAPVFLTMRIQKLADSDDRLLVVSTDVSEQKRLEAQARQAQRMQAVGRLAGGVAHDFNNLLTAIISFGSFAMRRVDEDDPAYQDLKQVLDAAARGEKLTKQLLAFSRHHKTSSKVVDVNATISGVEEMLARLLGVDIDFRVNLGAEMKNVRLDSAALDQVIVNLALNARDAMPEGGRLRISTGLVTLDESEARASGLAGPGEFVRIRVTDNGVGMAPDVMRHMFDPFFTTKESGKGTGLGLSTCWGIVQQARGQILVESEEGEGTTVSVLLPGVDADVTAGDDQSEAIDARGTETVVVAEDDDTVRELVVRALEDYGYHVIEAADGQDALEICQISPPGSIDLILTDVVMPRLNGTELVKRVRKWHEDAKFLYMSGYTDDANLEGDDVELLQKPFTPERVAERVRKVLDDNKEEWGEHVEDPRS